MARIRLELVLATGFVKKYTCYLGMSFHFKYHKGLSFMLLVSKKDLGIGILPFTLRDYILKGLRQKNQDIELRSNCMWKRFETSVETSMSCESMQISANSKMVECPNRKALLPYKEGRGYVTNLILLR